MRRVWVIALNDLRRTARERSSFFWMLVLPVALMWFFGSVGPDAPSGPPKIALEIIDRDGGWLARELVAELGGGEQLALEEIEDSTEMATVTNRRRVVIPEGFTAGVLAREQQDLVLQSHADVSAEFSLAAEVHLLRVIVRSLGRLVELDATGVLDQLEEQDLADRFRLLGARPALVSLAVSTAGEGTPVPTGMAQSVPGILAMMVLMMTMIYGGVFLAGEKLDGTLRRQSGAPVSAIEIFAGKLLGRFALGSLQVVILLAAGVFVFDVSFGSSPLALVLLLGSYSLAVAAMSTVLGALVATPDQASSVGWLASMVLAAMGGCWWPSEVMPSWLWSAAHVLPTAWAMDGLHALISFGRGLEGVLTPSLALLGFAALFAVAGSSLLRHWALRGA